MMDRSKYLEAQVHSCTNKAPIFGLKSVGQIIQPVTLSDCCIKPDSRHGHNIAEATTGSNTPPANSTKLQVTVQHKSGTALIWRDKPAKVRFGDIAVPAERGQLT